MVVLCRQSTRDDICTRDWSTDWRSAAHRHTHTHTNTDTHTHTHTPTHTPTPTHTHTLQHTHTHTHTPTSTHIHTHMYTDSKHDCLYCKFPDLRPFGQHVTHATMKNSSCAALCNKSDSCMAAYPNLIHEICSEAFLDLKAYLVILDLLLALSNKW